MGSVLTPLNDGTKGDFGGSVSILAFLGNGVLLVVFCIGYNLPEASLTHLELCPDVFEWDFGIPKLICPVVCVRKQPHSWWHAAG